MDELRAKALKEREELRDRLAELDAFLAVYDRLVGTKEEQNGSEEPRKVAPRLIANPSVRRKIGPDRIAEIAEKVIREAQKPMTRGELVDALLLRGITLGAKDKARYLGTILWRKPQFVNIEGSGYWIKGLPMPESPQRSVFE